MVEITFFGGVGEVGGNKILISDNDTRVFFDFGVSFARNKQYYAEFIQPRTCSGLGDLLEFGLIPEI